MSIRIAAALFAVAASLAGCGEASPGAQPTETLAPGDKAAKGAGTVTAVDAPAGRVTLDHQPIPDIGWPQMTMTFAVDPAMLADVKVGDQVEFDITLSRGIGTITALRVK